MLKGINQWCFVEGTPLEKIFDTCQKAGYDAVELNLYEPGGVGLTMDSTAAEAEAILALARGYGLQLRSLSTGLLGRYQLTSNDESIREKGRNSIKKQLELASILGIDTILVVPGRVTEDVSYDLCYRRSQEELYKILPEVESHKIYLAIENVWNKFLLSPLEMARYIDELSSPYAAAYYDVGNTLLVGFPDQWIRILNHRIKKVHVKDFKTSVGNGNGFVPLLAGDVNWNRVRTALREIGYSHQGTVTKELVEQTTHNVDLLRYLAGNITKVSADMALNVMQEIPGIDIPDVYSVNFLFASGAVGHLDTSFVDQPDGRSSLELIGRGFRVTLEGTSLTINEKDNTVITYKSEVNYL